MYSSNSRAYSLRSAYLRTPAKVRYVKSRLTGNAAAGNAGANNVVILGGLAYSSDFSQWVALLGAGHVQVLASDGAALVERVDACQWSGRGSVR